ncbi:water dikinase [Klebsormidium nitens]|uniref:Water dikinase n=1 Tax=Klebsormidium nitens TaxID=105231 RepID=A0A1Y1HKE7_KLENI|nr:water dikinase [Klebsormidium nitens]|eukprot:GAQ78092.1 water dikinase [Klebsormidium nitens]
MASTAALRLSCSCPSLASSSTITTDPLALSEPANFFGHRSSFYQRRNLQIHRSTPNARPHQPSLTKQGSGLSMRKHPRGGALAATAETSTAFGTKTSLKILLANQVNFGERHAVFGAGDALKNWQEAVEMHWTDGGWVLDVGALQPGQKVEFKAVIVHGDGGVQWENGPNRIIQLPDGGGAYSVTLHWEKTGEELQLQGVDGQIANGEAAQGAPTEAPKDAGNGRARSENGASEVSEFGSKWQGKDIAFMRSNEHSRERSGKWDTSNLSGPAARLVDGDKHGGSWWQKLEVVKGLVVPPEVGQKPDFDALVNANIYLQWINTGAISCVESGGHHRPNKHAEIARKIFRQLEWELGRKTTTSEEMLVLRRIQPRLPSFSEQFTQSVPLTRIRDIAHRNDIPHDLKQEIKHTIQNKLHRNAGPEDLVATEAMLQRVSKGDYSQDFVKELRVFYGELKDFFNAGSLTERLEQIRHSLDDSATSALDHFLSRKQILDDFDAQQKAEKLPEVLVGALHALTGLRAQLLGGLASGLRNDAPDSSLAQRQKWRLSEIGLEDYSFVLLSRFVNAVEEKGGPAALAEEAKKSNVQPFNFPLGATVLGIRHLGLSGWQTAECLAIENELHAWQHAGIVDREGPVKDVKTWALRLKATLDRARRLAESYSEALLEIYPERSLKLGDALGVPENSVRTFTEAEIRASVVFQLSKLCSLLLKALRDVIGGGGWDALVSGSAVGTLVSVDRIEPGALTSAAKGGPLILLVKEASGDEEVKAAGEEVKGVVLCQELPHLSHLGVRARQEGVVFVTAEDEEKVRDLRGLEGKRVKIDASAEGVTVEPFDGEEAVSSNNGAASAAGVPGKASSAGKIKYSPGGTFIELADTTVETGGAKAAACGEIAGLAKSSTEVKSSSGVPATFKSPTGGLIPFGALEAALDASKSRAKFNELVKKTETAKVEGGELDAVCNELRALIEAQRLPEKVIQRVGKAFSADARLIVRSSANVEDLAGMSGAGLYDSIPNVKASEPEEFAEAVSKVWASLFTRRAVLSRRVAGVPQKEAAMAILVQELLAPSLSFVLHTVSPVDGNRDIVQAEIALGLGETLASGTRGTPWRLAASKSSKTVDTLAFANFSEKLVVAGGKADGSMTREVADYSKVALTKDAEERIRLGQRLASIGAYLEKSLGAPQDVEGAVVGGDVYIVQSRPQPL